MFHAYGIVEDVKGNWYAFSPANYNRQNVKLGRIDPMTQILRASSLEEVLEQIEDSVDGEWLHAAEELFNYRNPKVAIKTNRRGEQYKTFEVQCIVLEESGGVLNLRQNFVVVGGL